MHRFESKIIPRGHGRKDSLVLRSSSPSATCGIGVHGTEAAAGEWDPVHARGDGIRRVSVGALEPLVDVRPFDPIQEAEHTGGSSDFQDALVFWFGMMVSHDAARLSRDQKPCTCP